MPTIAAHAAAPFASRWPASRPRAGLLLLHGLGEHGARYRALAGRLNERGIGVVAPDLPGHGRSGGRRGDAPDLDAMSGPLLAAWNELDPTLPRILCGHSFGGLLALHLAARLQPAALLLSSPFFGLTRPPAAWRRLAAALLLRLAPALPLPTGLDATALARDPAVVAAYRADPLVHARLSARLYASIRAAQAEAGQRAAQLRLPVLHWHGDADRLASVEASRLVHAQLPADPRNLLWIVPDGYHELLNDFGHEALELRLLAWLEQVLELP